MWLRHSLAVSLAVAFVAGCSFSHSKTHSAPEVADALRSHGFRVGVIARSDTEQELQKMFPQIAPKGVQSIVEVREARSPHTSDLVLAALIFKTQGQASCDKSNLVGTCLRKRNVVVVGRDPRVRAARQALDDLD